MSLLHNIDKKYLIRAWVILAIMIILQLLLSRWIGEETIKQRVESAGIRAPIVLIAYKTFSVVIAPLSGSVMYLVAWGLFGVWRGLLYWAIGNLLWMSLAYWIGHKRGHQAVWRLVGQSAMQEIQHLMGHLHDKKTFVITRCILLPLEDLINFASGMAKIPFLWFIVSSMIIVTTLSLIIVYLGDQVM